MTNFRDREPQERQLSRSTPPMFDSNERSSNDPVEWLESTLSDEQAMQRFCQFYETLLARTRRRISEKFRSRIGAEDILQTTFRTYYRRVIENKLGPSDENEAMAVITTIAYRKLMKKFEYFSAAKRGAQNDVTLGDLAMVLDPTNPSEDEQSRVEDIRCLTRKQLPTELWPALDKVMEGYTAAEIREMYPEVSDYFERMVRRKLREVLEQLIAMDSAA